MRPAIALSVAALAAATVPVAAAVIGGTYQDRASASCNSSQSCTADFAKVTGQNPIVVNVVTCTIEGASTPPYAVELTQSTSNSAKLFLPVAATGPAPTGIGYIAASTGLGYGVPVGSKPSVTVRFASSAKVKVTCGLTGE